VLHADTLVCEDAARHARPLCRIPSDYEKFFNTLLIPQLDAVLQARGVPDSVRRFYASAFQGTILRKSSSAAYVTSRGRRVATAGYSDDAEHYGRDDGVRVTSFDIWKGGQVTSVLRHTLPDASETLLGKPGVFSDKHSLAAEELLQKL
ncbi:unnamed protein product, partial [Effrenium voratum]